MAPCAMASGPGIQGSVTSFEPFHTSKQKYPSVPEKNEEAES